jgi:neutral ceramidase
MLVAALWACVDDPWKGAPEPLPEAIGAPRVGAAEGQLRLPIGTPLSGYTARCTCMLGVGAQDPRDSAYTTAFIESTGVQQWPTIKVIWITNGDEDLVVTKTDSIYSFDGLVLALEARLSEATGRDLRGRVVHTANHSHGSFGSYHQGTTWFLGSDKFDREIFERMADQIAAVAVEAHDAQQDAKIGVSWTKDWDPSDRVYRDRRGSNDALQPWGPDSPFLGKDPHLGLVRFDTLADEPIAMMVNFGMHGIIGSEQNSLATGDSGGHLEVGLEETFDRKVVVMYTQGSGGDASPAGVQDLFARMESIGEIGASLIRPIYDATETSAAPVSMETVTHAIHKHPSNIRLTRNGTTDLYYTPYDDSQDFHADDRVFAEDGSILSPIDEFNAPFGGVFCGSGDLDLPIGNLSGVTAFPYEQCLDVEFLAPLFEVYFELGQGNMPLPTPESLEAMTTLSRVGPVRTRLPDGSTVDQPWVVGFFPGEPVYSYGEQWRRRVKDELGFEQAMLVGYSQDHEGYLLIPEDWLTGGYEPDIGVWGPLEAEYVMEQVLETSGPLVVTTEVREDPDPLGMFRPTTFPEVPLDTDVMPDDTPDAGTRVTSFDQYFWTPWVEYNSEKIHPDDAELVIPPQVPRVQGILQIAWRGGDPMIDSPEVVLERQEGGGWVPVVSGSGRPVTSGRTDILLGHTPDPLYPVNGPQTHTWWAGWQAVPHWQDRAALPLGTYRLTVRGQAKDGDTEHWPWSARDYSWSTEAFEVVPAALTLEVDPYGAGLFVSLRAPENGYRLVHLDGDENGDNPVEGTLQVQIVSSAGTDDLEIDAELAPPRSFVPVTLGDWTEIRVTDAHGNTGTLVRP